MKLIQKNIVEIYKRYCYSVDIINIKDDGTLMMASRLHHRGFPVFEQMEEI